MIRWERVPIFVSFIYERKAYMEKKQNYRVVEFGKKAKRRDYSKVSGSLELPNLVEIQTDSFDWYNDLFCDGFEKNGSYSR